ncbi:major facilitator superfamily domain-containing protein [Phthorimaea operculella]|nr:major facilitator superfamily domain-containing protein [Phthorimaea operculella]
MKKDNKKPTTTKSVILPQGKAGEGVEEGEETEVAAQVHIPPEGGWSWVVLAASFFSIFIIDGCCMSFGAMLHDISVTLKIPVSQTALINSIEIFLYFVLSPISSALINRFGFRTVALIGSMICSLGLLCAHFGRDFASLIIFLGVMTGMGCSLINMAASLIVGFYFEKRRSIAMAISSGGGAAGTMTLYPVNTLLVKKAGFKNALLLHAGLHGIIYFLCLTFRPLLSLTVTQVEEEGNPTRTVTFLPTIAAGGDKETKGGKATAAERMIGAVSNAHFPTAAQFFQNTSTTTASTQPGPTSTSARPGVVSRITLQAQGEVNTKQLKQMQSIVSRIQMQDTKTTTPTEITVQAVERKKKPWYRRIFDWEPDSPASRPMYRDDAFYDGKVEKLPVYQKSVAAIKEENRTGLEYQLAVTRAVRVDDVQQRRGCCTQAVRRVLVSMVDPSLLKKSSFLLFSVSGLLTNFGVFVPYVFLQDRNSPLYSDIGSLDDLLFHSRKKKKEDAKLL